MQLTGLGDRWEAEIRRTHNREMGTFVPPTREQGMRVEQLVRDLRDAAVSGEPLDEVQEDAAELGLEVVELESHLLLQDPTERGWGKMLFRCGAPTGLVIEVPHPLSDYRTPELGLRMFEQSGADVYLLSGTNRFNRAEPSLEQPKKRLSDGAHSSATFFHSAHCGLVGSGDCVLQVHGFDSQGGDPTVVVSDGLDDGADPAELRHLAGQLDQHHVPHLIADFESSLGKRLGARTNLQGQQRDCVFLHMEVGDEARQALEPSLIGAVADWAREEFR